jgi:hypothetical protein
MPYFPGVSNISDTHEISRVKPPCEISRVKLHFVSFDLPTRSFRRSSFSSTPRASSSGETVGDVFCSHFCLNWVNAHHDFSI